MTPESRSENNEGQNRVTDTGAAADGVASRLSDGRTSDAGAVTAASAPINETDEVIDLPDFLRWGDEARDTKGEAA